VIRREIGDEAEHDGDLTDDHETKQITASNLKRSLSVLSDAIDQSPRRKKKKKSSERLTQIRLEEVSAVYLTWLTSSSRMHVMNHNWSVRKQRPHPQSAAGISCHPALPEDRTRQRGTSPESART